MLVKTLNGRFNTEMWSDARLVDKQGVFCLCSVCLKENADLAVECPTHKQFMKMTRLLQVAAPVFGCPGFEEDNSRPKPLEAFFGDYRVIRDWTFANDWAEQKRIWGLDDNLQPIRE